MTTEKSAISFSFNQKHRGPKLVKSVIEDEPSEPVEEEDYITSFEKNKAKR